jgi:hypothetical protein
MPENAAQVERPTAAPGYRRAVSPGANFPPSASYPSSEGYSLPMPLATPFGNAEGL